MEPSSGRSSSVGGLFPLMKVGAEMSSGWTVELKVVEVIG